MSHNAYQGFGQTWLKFVMFRLEPISSTTTLGAFKK